MADDFDAAGEAMVGAAWVQERMGLLEKQMRTLSARAEAAEQSNRELVSTTQSLRAQLDAQMRLADEKLNQEIRERSELQMAMRMAEKEQTSEKSAVQSLSTQVVSLQLALQEARQQQQQLAAAVDLAATADAATAQLKAELASATEAATAERERLAERGGRLEDAIGRVRNELFANAEQVGNELRLRMQAIQAVDDREATDARAAVDASRELAERLADVSEELKGAESELREEQQERRASEIEAAQAREAIRSTLQAQQEAAAAQAAEEIASLKQELAVREHAEQALKAMLAASHEQQGALEDHGNSTQAGNQATFDELRALISALDVRVTEEVGQREAAFADASRLIEAEAEAREVGLQGAREAAAAATAAAEQVLRTEIRARMKGEASLTQKLHAQGEAATTAAHRLQQALDEASARTGRQLDTLTGEIAAHAGRTEADLATVSERLEAVTGRQASTIAALHKEHNDLVKATRAAVGALKTTLEAELAALEKRRVDAVAAVQAKLEADDAALREATTLRFEETEATMLAKLEDATEAISVEKLERTASVAEAVGGFESALAAHRAVVAVVERATSERLAVHGVRLEQTDRRLDQTATELRRMDAAIQEAAKLAAAELQAQIDDLAEELSTTNGQLEAQAEVQMAERAERVAAVRHSTEMAAAAVGEVAADLSRTEGELRDELRTASEAQAAALSEVQYKTQRNLHALQEALQQGLQDADQHLQQLEQHCAHQLQHGLDALGANLEHLLESGIALEAMARQDADAHLSADASKQYDALETSLHEQHSQAAYAAEEIHTAAEVRACLADMIATVEAEDMRAARDGTAAALEAEVARATAFEASLSARLQQVDFKHEGRGEATTERVAALELKDAEGVDALRTTLEATRHELVLATARHTQQLAEERDERIQAVEEAETLTRELEERQTQAEVAAVLEDALQRLVQASEASAAREAHAALVDTVETLHVATSRRIGDVQAEAGAEAAALRLVASTAEAALAERLETEVSGAREEAAASVTNLRREDEERRAALEDELRGDLRVAYEALEGQIEDKIAATLRAAEEKEVVEETVQRLIEALEEREQYDAETARQKQLAALEEEMNERRMAAAAEAEAERAAQQSRATEIENEVVRLSTRLEKVETEATAKYAQATELVAAAGAEMEQKCAAQMGTMQAVVDGTRAETEEKLSAAEARMKELDAAAKQAEASVEALKLGLGLGGVGDGNKLATASELEALQARLEADLAKVNGQLEAATSKFEASSEKLQTVAEEARALKLERVQQEKEDAEKAAAREKEEREAAQRQAARAAEEAAESLAQKEAADAKAKKAEEERARAQAAAKQAEAAEAKAKAEAASAKEAAQSDAPAAPPPGQVPEPEADQPAAAEQ